MFKIIEKIEAFGNRHQQGLVFLIALLAILQFVLVMSFGS